jgi:maleylpyruvate isomerase
VAGRFLVGNNVSFADVLLIPELGFARRHGIPLEPYPLLRRVDDECARLPAFQAAHPDAQPDHEPPT